MKLSDETIKKIIEEDSGRLIPFLSREKIEQIAFRDLLEYRRKEGKEQIFPLDVEKFSFQIWGLETDFIEGLKDRIGNEVYGALEPMSRKILVNLGAKVNEGNENWTIVHETGHFVLHVPESQISPGQKGLFDIPKKQAPILCRVVMPKKFERREWQADQYTANLLMPSSELLRLYPQKKIDLSKEGRPACEYFNVSKLALQIRLQELNFQIENLWYQLNEAEDFQKPLFSIKSEKSY